MVAKNTTADVTTASVKMVVDVAYREMEICHTPIGGYMSSATDFPQQKAAGNKEVMYEDMKISSQMQNSEPKIPSATDIDFAEIDATELEIVSAANAQTTTTVDELTSSVMQNTELENEYDLKGDTVFLSKDVGSLILKFLLD
ncbi:hypothetical protein LOAG_01293 [Loa loa]|uniref:Uncharacterized protein n=1 Tax=Loa loa TaxID=7209 RepID=A0A1S0U976_LOALO|nr:hypothetical protein LOAG_01293 [Loa loa]EFO27187.2 hypothetical protein LOAG_01293 [Loa loa]